MTHSRRQGPPGVILCVVLVLALQACATAKPAPQSPQPLAEQSNEQRIEFLVDMSGSGAPWSVQRVLDLGAYVNGKAVDGRIALNAAARGGHLAVMELLIARGASVDLHDEEVRRGGLGCFDTVPECYLAGYSSGGNTALHLVARYAQTHESSRTPKIKQMVDLLLAHGADVNASAKAGDTPLHYAAWRLEKDLVELLIARGANVNARDKNGDTPLTYAATSPLYKKMPLLYAGDHAKVVELIRQHGGK